MSTMREKMTPAPYEIALDLFRDAVLDYEDEMRDQFGVEDAPAAKVMWRMIEVLDDPLIALGSDGRPSSNLRILLADDDDRDHPPAVLLSDGDRQLYGGA